MGAQRGRTGAYAAEDGEPSAADSWCSIKGKHRSMKKKMRVDSEASNY